jgi:hypothetical protein
MVGRSSTARFAVGALIVAVSAGSSACDDGGGSTALVGGVDAAPLQASSCVAVDTTCPAPPPRYGHDVAPIVTQYCLKCHSPEGLGASPALSTYDGVVSAGSRFHDVVSGCVMPPSPSPAPDAESRAVLLRWFACGEHDD